MKIIKEHRYSILGILAITFILMSPLILNSYHQNDDSVYHFANVLSLKSSMQTHGIFASPILPDLAHNFGYASHLLYPPLAHTFTAFLAYVFDFLSITSIFKIVHIFVLFCAGVSMYQLAYQFTKSKKIAFFSSALYMSFPYQLTQTYVRDSLGESFVFIFVPMILSSFLALFQNNKKLFYPLFVFGYVGGILSHFTVMIFVTMMMMIFLFLYRKKVFQKEFLKPFLISCGFVLGLSLFYLAPMIEYKLKGGIAVFLPNLMSSGVYYFSLWPWQYFPFSYSSKDVDFYFTTISIILLFLTILKRKEIRYPEYTKGIVAIFLVSMFLTSKLFYWDILPSITYMIQFPWRLCLFLGIGISLIAPLIFLKWKEKKIYFVSLFLLISLSVLAIHYRNDSILNKSYNEFMTEGAAMGWQHEYLPENALNHEDYYNNRNANILAKDGDSAVILSNQVPNLVFEAKENSTLELPRFYYIGYELLDDENKSIPIYENEMGMIEVRIPKNGIYSLHYPGTKVQKVSNVITIISIFSFLFFSFFLIFQSEKSK